MERTSGKNNWDETNVNDFKTINYEKAPNDLMSSILINLCMTIIIDDVAILRLAIIYHIFTQIFFVDRSV